MRKKLKWSIAMFILTAGLWIGQQSTQAMEIETKQQVSIPEFYYTGAADKNNKIIVSWYMKEHFDREKGTSEAYEIEIASNNSFTHSKKIDVTERQVSIARSEFGTDGGKLYFRVRQCVQPVSGSAIVGDWSETKELVYVAINKKNFPGLYHLLKKGGVAMSLDGSKRKEVYDLNQDGWLEPEEIYKLTSLSTENYRKKKQGKYVFYPSSKVSSFQGVEYLNNLQTIQLVHYSGKKIDLSQNKIWSLDIRGITSKKITVISPTAKNVFIESAYTAKMKRMDLSKCTGVVDLRAYGNSQTKVLKLPKNKEKLKILSISGICVKELNLNKYKNLQQFYAYGSDVRKVTLNQCTKLRYVYFYYCNKIRSLNLTANKKLRGMDAYASKGLTKSTVKVPKSAKVTWNKGKWWYSTKSYKKDMKNIYA